MKRKVYAILERDSMGGKRKLYLRLSSLAIDCHENGYSLFTHYGAKEEIKKLQCAPKHLYAPTASWSIVPVRYQEVDYI